MCGKCCTLAEDAEVWISAAEVAAMAQHLGISVADMEARYCQPYSGVEGWRLLQSKLVDAPQQQQQQLQQQQQQQQQQQVCVFLNEDRSCGVYPVRPLQCSTYPWWPELMPQRNWAAEREVMCEGLDHPDAEPLDRWHVAQQLQAATHHTLALEAAKPRGWDAQEQLYSE